MAEELRKISPEELKQILAEHKKWLDSKGTEGKQSDLSNANLIEADLREATLIGATLIKASLLRTTLRGTTFKNTKTDLTIEELKKRGAIVIEEDKK